MPPGALARKISARNSQLLFGRIVSSGDWDAATAVPPATAQDGQFWKATSAGAYGGATIPNGALCLFSENLSVVHFLPKEAAVGGGGSDWGGEWNLSPVVTAIPYAMGWSNAEAQEATLYGALTMSNENKTGSYTSVGGLEGDFRQVAALPAGTIAGTGQKLDVTAGVHRMRLTVDEYPYFSGGESYHYLSIGMRAFTAVFSEIFQATSTAHGDGTFSLQISDKNGLVFNEENSWMSTSYIDAVFDADQWAITFYRNGEDEAIGSMYYTPQQVIGALWAIETGGIPEGDANKTIAATLAVAQIGAASLPVGAAEGKEYVVTVAGTYNNKSLAEGDVVKFIVGTDVISVTSAAVMDEDTVLSIVNSPIYAAIAWHAEDSNPHSQYVLVSAVGASVAGLVDGKVPLGQLPAKLVSWDMSPQYSDAFPLGDDAVVRGYLSATESLTGTGIDGQTVNYTSSVFGNSGCGSHSDATGAGVVTMGASPIWFEWELSGTGWFRAMVGALAVVEPVGITGYSVYVSTNTQEYSPVVLTIGLFPNGDKIVKRNGTTVNSSAGGPTTGQKFAPFVNFYFMNPGNTGTATLVSDHASMQYAGEGVGLQTVLDTNAALPAEANPGVLLQSEGGGFYASVPFSDGDVSVLLADGVSVRKVAAEEAPVAWAAPTFNTGWGYLAANVRPGYRKTGRKVEIRGAFLVPGHPTTGDSPYTLPAGFTPATEKEETFSVVKEVWNGSSYDLSTAKAVVKDTGVIQIVPFSNAAGQIIYLSGYFYTE